MNVIQNRKMALTHLAFCILICLARSATIGTHLRYSSSTDKGNITHLVDGDNEDVEDIKVENCPSDCSCYLFEDNQLQVDFCHTDPADRLPALFKSYPDITTIYIMESHLSRLPDEILNLTKLTAVHLDQNDLKVIPNVIFNITQLTSLHLTSNRLSRIPAAISALTNLKILDLGRNSLEGFPIEIVHLPSLIWLRLSDDGFRKLPPEIGKLTSLVKINLSKNMLISLPNETGAMSRLQIMFLDKNLLEIFPLSVCDLSIQQLSLRKNKIRALPTDVKNMTKLQKLHLDDNLLTGLPGGFLPDTLTNVTLARNRFQVFPCHLFELPNIVHLDVSHNVFKQIECNGTANKGLMTLILKSVELSQMPCALEDLVSGLENLDLSNNSISIIPNRCSTLTQSPLRFLDLSSNNFTSVSLGPLCNQFNNKYVYLNLSNNKIDKIDVEHIDIITQCFSYSSSIDLSMNILTSMDSWPMSMAMHIGFTLNVVGNQLGHFSNSHHTAFTNPKYKSKFLMQQNQIKHFMDIFDGWEIAVNTTKSLYTFMGNIFFDLSENPLVCDCIDFEIYKYIQTQPREQFKNLTCREPRNLQGKNPYDEDLSQFVCELNVTCPLHCQCMNVPLSQSLNITCSQYDYQDIPESVPNLPGNAYMYSLIMPEQNLTSLSEKSYLYRTNMIKVSNNKITNILINSSEVLENVIVLHLDGNQLEHLPASIVQSDNLTLMKEIKLENNPWVCDCEAMLLKTWIIANRHIVKDIGSIKCFAPESMVGKEVVNIESSLVCPNENKAVVYAVLGISGCVFLVIIAAGVIDRLKIARLRLVGSDECEGEGKEFDVFVSYATEDEEYVERYLIPELEKHDFRVCFHRVHFHGGKPIIVNMSEAIEKSKRTLVFFSADYNRSNFGMFEYRLALHLDVQNNTRRLIIIKETNLDINDLDISDVHYFRTHTYVKQEDPHFLKNLMYALPRRRLGAERY